MSEFNTVVKDGKYKITFETDDKKAYEQVQSLCRLLVDSKYDEIPIEWIEKYIWSVILTKKKKGREKNAKAD